MADPRALPLPQEAEALSSDRQQSGSGPEAEASLRAFPGDPGAAEVLELCFRELVRYYRHSSAGRRCTGIVHQLNTPLQVLSFQLELLQQKSREELASLREGVLPGAEKLRALHSYREQKLRQFQQEVENLQIFTRHLLLQGVHEENQEKFYLDLNQIYQQELDLYLTDPFFKHQAEKNFSFADGLPPLYGHYLDFSQSFRNLVDNALEAMAGAALRELTIETLLQEGLRILRIGDTGVGIPKDLLPRIFHPFFTTKGTPESPRAGLGLFMARRLLAPYGGRIQVESRPGRTWVTVLLPVATES